jgi:hypothetical protein
MQFRGVLAENKALAARLDPLEARIELEDQDQAIVEILRAIRELMSPAAREPKRRAGFV